MAKAVNPVATAGEWGKLQKLCGLIIGLGMVDYPPMLRFVGVWLIGSTIDIRFQNRVSKMTIVISISSDDVAELKKLEGTWDPMGLDGAIAAMIEKKIRKFMTFYNEFVEINV